MRPVMRSKATRSSTKKFLPASSRPRTNWSVLPKRCAVKSRSCALSRTCEVSPDRVKTRPCECPPSSLFSIYASLWRRTRASQSNSTVARRTPGQSSLATTPKHNFTMVIWTARPGTSRKRCGETRPIGLLCIRVRKFSAEKENGIWRFAIAMRSCDRRARLCQPHCCARRPTSNSGITQSASKELDHVVAIEPIPQYYAMAFNQRAWFRATCLNPSFRKPQQAIEDAKKACSITQWREADSIDTLAVACAESGDFESAVRYVEQAMQAYDAAEITKTLQQHLAMFKQQRRVTAR